MKVFKDKDGRDWEITIDIGQIKRVRDLAKVNLYAIFEREAERVFSDPVLLVDTLYALCRSQCAERKMSDEDFGKIFDGAVLEAAADALLEESLNFSPPSRQKILRATIEKSKTLRTPLEEELLKKIAALTVTDLLKLTESQAS
jgi:hypothetical protein